MYIYIDMARTSRRIEFDEEDIEFLKDYKMATGLSLQEVIETLLKRKIQEIKSEIEFNDLKLM